MHDLRHSFASAALAAGLSLAQIGELLGHRHAQTTMGYAHLMKEVGQANADTVGLEIKRRLKGG
jgi:site-specific recombinase XerD